MEPSFQQPVQLQPHIPPQPGMEGDVTSTSEPPVPVVHQACALSLNAYTMTVQ